MRFLVDEGDLSSRERALLAHLRREYTDAIARDVLLPLLSQTAPVSLRALDWTVVNWSKQHNIVCSSIVPGQMTNIHHAYRATLAFWKRRLFDPFRRRRRIRISVDGQEWETTLGQANFALFTYQTGILSYVIGHIDAIEADMNRISRRQKRERYEARKQGVKRPRRELTAPAGPLCVAYRAPYRAVFSGS